ncbi:hypothetical protein Tco_0875107 [Tanacetum coccineum]|uniref:Secreted protein n=1 Tax=Tanacetum coccineum TaxID=301880 RepID=A0ABQ5BNI8_9ASTR
MRSADPLAALSSTIVMLCYSSATLSNITDQSPLVGGCSSLAFGASQVRIDRNCRLWCHVPLSGSIHKWGIYIDSAFDQSSSRTGGGCMVGIRRPARLQQPL